MTGEADAISLPMAVASRYMRKPSAPCARKSFSRRTRPMAALVALGLAVGIFAILNLIDNKRLD